MALKPLHFSRLWNAALVLLFCLLIKQIVGQQPGNSLEENQDENQPTFPNKMLSENQDDEQGLSEVDPSNSKSKQNSNSDNGQYQIPFSVFFNALNKKDDPNGAQNNISNEELRIDPESIEDSFPEIDFNSQNQEIPFEDILNESNIKDNNVPKHILYEGKSNSELYEIPFSDLLKAQHKKEGIVSRQSSGKKGHQNLGLREIPFSLLDKERIQGHKRKYNDDSDQIYFKYNQNEGGAKDSDYGNGQSVSDYPLLLDISQSSAVNEQLKEILYPNEEDRPSIENFPISLTQESNGEVPVIYKPLKKKHHRSFSPSKICEATYGHNSSYTPSILEAILESKRRKQYEIDYNILVSRLSPIFLSKKLQYSDLSHDEVFAQLLLESFLSAIKIIKHSESSCINHALEFSGRERYVEGFREILYLKRLFLQPHEDVAKLI